MGRSLLLLLGAGRLLAQQMADGKAAAQQIFPNTPEGRDEFAAFLHGVRCPAYLLTDLVEEDFRHETVPHLFGRNRAALLARKLEQFYRGTPYRQATLLRRQKNGRRDDQILFSALTNPALVTPWVEMLLAQRIPLVGIYSVPQISGPLVKRHAARYLLLVSWENCAGLRQTFFSEHRLLVSRLTPVYPGTTFQDAVVHELARTCQYLKSLGLLPSGQILDVCLLGNRHDLLGLQPVLPRSADVRYDYTELADVGKHLAIGHDFPDSDATRIFLHQLHSKPPRTSYADAGHTRYYGLWRIGRSLRHAAAATLFGALLWSGANLWASRADDAETASIEADARRMQTEAQQIRQTFPHTRAPASDMKSAVSLMRTLDAYAPPLRASLQPVSEVLERFPQAELTVLEWRADAGEAVAENTRSDVPAQLILLTGTLSGFGQNYRAALEYLNRLQAALVAQGYRVAVLGQPLDVSPAGNLADPRETGERRPLGFALRLAGRPPA